MKHINQLVLEMCDRLDESETEGKNLEAKTKALTEIRENLNGDETTDFMKQLRE